MTSAHIRVAARPERVWAVLADARSYAFWVVGARAVHESDANWPATGSTLRHSQGRAPLVLSDIPVLREVAGDAALYAPPDRPDVWAERIADLLTDESLGGELRRRGTARAGHFDWGRAAGEAARAFREAAERA